MLIAAVTTMTYNSAHKSDWLGFLGFRDYENEPEFRQEILKLSRQGMLVAGLLGVMGIFAYVVAKSFFVNASISWTYKGIDPATTIVLWDKLIILTLSIVSIVLSRTANGALWGRALMVAMVIVFFVSSMLDDLIIGKGYTTTFLVLFLSIAVGTMPYRAWQTFLFGLLIIFVITICVEYLPVLVGVPYLRMAKTIYVFLAIITIIYTGISGLLYSSRYEQYVARKKAEDLKKQLEVTHKSLQGSYKKLSEAQDQLVHAQKVAAMGRVTAGIAHEIKNPLNFINNFSELIEELSEDLKEEFSTVRPSIGPEKADLIDEMVSDLRENAKRVHKHGQRANEILDQMLDHSRLNRGEMEPTDVSSLLEKYVNLSRLNLKAEFPNLPIEIKQDLKDDLLEIELAPKEMGQVVMNLMTNAFDAINLKAKSQNGSYQPYVEVSSYAVDNKHIEIKIEDNGAGIASDAKEKIFEPFFTTTRRTGLGLSLAHEIITQRYNGNLRFDSKEGEGSSFIISLPFSKEKVA